MEAARPRLLRLLRGEIEPTSGDIRKADSLRVVYFDQNRQLDPEMSLRRALAPDSDSVIYQERVISRGLVGGAGFSSRATNWISRWAGFPAANARAF